jgi:hypothetical protein
MADYVERFFNRDTGQLSPLNDSIINILEMTTKYIFEGVRVKAKRERGELGPMDA